ncbi:tripartite tricarboxylate transporter TctB family protein [Roseiarcaceae bacterium H3SJ34-1]|uniref:tripartite tricarboxylate transporter TctB family protein n=1 Tax=Terripilifer ovatus TaxID=3032367 RepID=UPI003AB91DD1|nr:tripartite tricarboxylate transporter TctB family protein [Roseiarcaceae bacterium H3SJ34-1]
MVRVKSPQDFWAGLLFICFGALALFLGRNYAFGTVTRMGPGFLPTVLAWILFGLGVIIAVRGIALDGPSIAPGKWRPQIFILLAIVLFGLLIERVGLAPTVFVVGVVAAFASIEVKWKEAVLLSAGVALLSILLFIKLLGQSMAPWMWSP